MVWQEGDAIKPTKPLCGTWLDAKNAGKEEQGQDSKEVRGPGQVHGTSAKAPFCTCSRVLQ